MGKFFEEFEIGQQFDSPRRTITETDIVNFAGLTGDYNPVHTDAVFAAKTAFGERIAHGPMLIGISFGLLSRLDVLDGTVIALRDIEWRFKAPVRIGDTISLSAIVSVHHLSERAPDRGYVKLQMQLTNQHDESVQEGSAGVIIRTRDHAI